MKLKQIKTLFSSFDFFLIIWFSAFSLDYGATLVGMANGFDDENPLLRYAVEKATLTPIYLISGFFFIGMVIIKILWHLRASRIMWVLPMFHIFGLVSWLRVL